MIATQCGSFGNLPHQRLATLWYLTQCISWKCLFLTFSWLYWDITLIVKDDIIITTYKRISRKIKSIVSWLLSNVIKARFLQRGKKLQVVKIWYFCAQCENLQISLSLKSYEKPNIFFVKLKPFLGKPFNKKLISRKNIIKSKIPKCPHCVWCTLLQKDLLQFDVIIIEIRVKEKTFRNFKMEW